ncbi:MAG: hypothetical protein JXC85_06370 [Candidatus Aenigmarchaeota archaeon]|nr:hypothetical protein [Candidatus Aenigmarchaeota archaeon]
MMERVSGPDGKGWREFMDQFRSGAIRTGDYAEVDCDNNICYRVCGGGRLTFFDTKTIRAEEAIGNYEWHSFRYSWESSKQVPDLLSKQVTVPCPLSAQNEP